MKRISQEIKDARGWYYIGKIKWYKKPCDYCGKMYEKPDCEFYCTKRCMRLDKPIIKFGKDNSSYKKGLPNCIDCGIILNRYDARWCRPCWKKFYVAENTFWWVEDRVNLPKHNRREDPAYKEWRKNVYTRDNFQCRIQDENCGGRLEAHHILRWSLYPELRYELNNGITLCHAHHPRKVSEEKRLKPLFEELVSVSRG